jgi:hypothetical protein
LKPEVENLSEVFAIAQTAIGNLLVHELGLYTEMNLMFSRLSHHRMSLAVEEDVRDEDFPVGSECCWPVRKCSLGRAAAMLCSSQVNVLFVEELTLPLFRQRGPCEARTLRVVNPPQCPVKITGGAPPLPN